MSQAGHRSPLRQALRLVKLLSAIGLGSGILILVVVWLTVMGIRSETNRLDALEKEFTEVLTSFTQNAEHGRAELQSLLRGENALHPDWIGGLRQDLIRLRELGHLPEASAVWDEVHPHVQETIKLRAKCQRWGAEYAHVVREFPRAEERISASLGRLREAVARAAGRQQLEQAVQVRKYRQASGSEKDELARRTVEILLPSTSLPEIRTEVTDLSLLAAQMSAAEELASLADYRDNRVWPVLARLRKMLGRLDSMGRDDIPPLTPMLDEVEAHLFGEGTGYDSRHQLTVEGSGGLYALIEKRIALERERPLLEARCANAFGRLGEARLRIETAHSGVIRDLNTQSARLSYGAWRLILGFGLVFSVAFLAVASRITKAVGNQVAIVEETNRRLDEQAASLEKAVEHANSMAMAAQAANTAKGQFLATMSHEIRTPLNGVMGMAQLLMSTQLTSEQEDYTKSLMHSGEALLSVINDVLDFSKIEAGRVELEDTDFDLREVVEGVGHILGPRAQGKGLEFAVLLPSDVPTHLRGDPARLRQILINLAGNAVKFTERGEVVIQVGLDVMQPEEDGAPKIRLRFEVTDTGIGIAEELHEQLFRPFTQADQSTTRRFGGTGLGLSICKQLTEAMGGTIGVRSGEGKGSTFWFTAVFGCGDASALLKASAAESTLRRLRVLVVDGNSTSRLVLRQYIESFGCSVREAASAGEAMDLLATVHEVAAFHIALLDSQLDGGESCLELCRRIRRLPGPNDIRLVMTTPAHGRADTSWMLDQGFDACLTEPVRQDELRQVFLELASGKEEESAPPETGQRPLGGNVKPGASILLVEDNAMNRRLAEQMLGKLGYTCDSVGDGVEALNALQSREYALILMDCQMPVMDGFETCRAIREREGTSRHTPVVAMTALAMGGDEQRCAEAGMDGYLTKPLTFEAVSEALVKHLDGGDTKDGIPPSGPSWKNDGAPHVDESRLAEVTMGDVEAERQLISIFLEDTGRALAHLTDSLAKADAAAAEKDAHAIKGGARNIGAKRLADMALAVERMAREEGVEAVTEQMAAFRREAETLVKILKRRLERI